MALRHGKNAAVTVNSVSLTAYCDSAEISLDTDTAETSTFGNQWKTHLTGMSGGTATLSGNYDPTASTGPAVVLSGLIGDDPFPVLYYPGGNVAGQVLWTFNAILTSYQESSSASDKVTFSAGLLITGTATPSLVGA